MPLESTLGASLVTLSGFRVPHGIGQPRKRRSAAPLWLRFQRDRPETGVSGSAGTILARMAGGRFCGRQLRQGASWTARPTYLSLVATGPS